MSSLTRDLIPLSVPHLTGIELRHLSQLNTDSLRLVRQFESQMCQTVGAKFGLATQSGTLALELALRALGVEAGDKVICPTLTFVATANAIDAVKGQPVFVGSEPTTWGLDPDALETALRKLRQRPQAIIVVDLYGMPARWSDLKIVADRHEVPIIADAAESLGSWLNGHACGTMGQLNVVSFNTNKIITTFGGGALFTDDLTLVKRASIIANQGQTTEPPYTQSMTGGNYRLSPLNAGYGLEQLAVLTERVEARRAVFSRYHQALAHRPGVSFQPELPDAVSNRWLTALIIDSRNLGITRDTMAQLLRLEGIETRPVFTPLHRLPPFEACSFYGSSLADDLAETGLCLPSSSSLSEEDVERVIQAFTKHCGTLQPKRAVISS